MKIHDLKIWPEYCRDVLHGKKTFEVRRNDRHFEVGDVLRLREWDPELGKPGEHDKVKDIGSYTGLYFYKLVTYILPRGSVGMVPGYCVMALEAIGPEQVMRMGLPEAPHG